MGGPGHVVYLPEIDWDRQLVRGGPFDSSGNGVQPPRIWLAWVAKSCQSTFSGGAEGGGSIGPGADARFGGKVSDFQFAIIGQEL